MRASSYLSPSSRLLVASSHRTNIAARKNAVKIGLHALVNVNAAVVGDFKLQTALN